MELKGSKILGRIDEVEVEVEVDVDDSSRLGGTADAPPAYQTPPAKRESLSVIIPPFVGRVVNSFRTSTIFVSTDSWDVAESRSAKIRDNKKKGVVLDTFEQEVHNREKALLPNSYKAIFQKPFLRAFGFDGYDPTTGMVTAADGTTALLDLDEDEFPLGLVLASLFGLPSRPATATDLKLTFLQFVRNMIGGWNPIKETIVGVAVHTDTKRFDGTPITQAVVNLGDRGQIIETKSAGLVKVSPTQYRMTEKKILLSVLFIFKVAFITTFKIITWPFKVLLNMVKLVTEFLLPVVSTLIAVFVGTKLMKFTASLVRRFAGGKETFRLGLHNLWVFPLLPVLAVTLVVNVAEYAMLWACRMGLALTSPAKSFRLAFDAGYSFPVENKVVKTIMGVIGATLSLAMSAVLWTIMLPLALGALIIAIPQTLVAINWVAQLPLVASSLAWFSSLPVVTASTALVNSFFATVGGALASVFGPLVTAMVQVPATVLAVGLTLGMIVTPIAAFFSELADFASNAWAKWVEQRPIHSIFSRTPRARVAVKEGVELESVSPAPPAPPADSSSTKVEGDAEEATRENESALLLPTSALASAKKSKPEPKMVVDVPLEVFAIQEKNGNYVVSGNATRIAEFVRTKNAAIDDAALTQRAAKAKATVDAQRLAESHTDSVSVAQASADHLTAFRVDDRQAAEALYRRAVAGTAEGGSFTLRAGLAPDEIAEMRPVEERDTRYLPHSVADI